MKLILTSAGFENPKISDKFFVFTGKPISETKVIFVQEV